MIRRLSTIIAILAGPVAAEEGWPYAPIVHDCYETATGTVGADQCIGDAAEACMGNRYNTVRMMVFCLSDEAAIWDELLNQEYASARDAAQRWDEIDRSLWPDTAVRDEQVLLAQRAWIAFRDANCSMAHGRYGSGTLNQVAGTRCQMRMTAERVLELERYRGPKG